MKNNRFVLRLIITITIVIILFAGANKVFAHAHHNINAGDSEWEISYSLHIKPIFDQQCAKCHGSKSPEHMEFMKDMKKYVKKHRGPRMDHYSFLTSFVVWPDTGSLMRAIDDGKNTVDNMPGKMYKHLGRTDEERQNNLKFFKEWVGYWTLKDWSTLSKNEINKIKVTY